MALAIVDSSVILDIFTADSQFYQQSLECLVQVGSYRTLGINGIVYSEISLGFNRIEDLDEALFGTGLKFLDIPREALFLAARAFAAYRRRGGFKNKCFARLLYWCPRRGTRCPNGDPRPCAGVPCLSGVRNTPALKWPKPNSYRKGEKGQGNPKHYYL